MNNGEVAACFDVVNAATTAAQIPADVSLELVRCDVFNLHNGLQ